MRYLNSYVDLILQNIGYILFIYFVFVIIQIICLYYEYNEKNLFLFFGNKGLLFGSILTGYIFKDNSTILLVYFIGLVLLTKFVDNKYEENYSKDFTRRYFLFNYIRINIFLYSIKYRKQIKN